MELTKSFEKSYNTIVANDIEEILKEDLPWETIEGSVVLITGANGFIPNYIVRTFIAIKNVKVLALVRNEENAKERFADLLDNKNFKLIIQDINVPFSIDEKVDYIIHAASQASPKYYGVDPVGTLKTNCLGTSYLLDIGVKNKIKKFIFISSGEVYGNIDETTPELTETYTGKLDCTNLRSCYGESKRMGENMCVCYSHQYNIPVNMLRLSHIYGYGFKLDDGRAIPDFVSNIVNNKDIVLNSDGSAKRSFCYISDMIRAFFYVFFKGENKNAYNIASDKETSILEIARMLTEAVPEKNLEVRFRESVYREGYIKAQSTRANFNTEKLKTLGWKEKVDIKNGLAKMVKAYEEKEVL